MEHLSLLFLVIASSPIVKSEGSSTEQTVYPNEKIYVCGNRIREVMRYVCPRLSNQHYYTPGSHQDQQPEPDQIPHHRHRHRHGLPYYSTAQGGEQEILPKRLRRQIVKECCNQPCYEKALLKYCGLSGLGSTAMEAMTDELQLSDSYSLNQLLNGRNIVQKEVMEKFKSHRKDAPSKMQLGEDKLFRNPGFAKRQRKKLAKGIALGWSYVPMVVLPYAFMGAGENAAKTLMRTNWIWRYISSEHDGTNRVRVGPWSRGMQVITEPPQPEPVILLPDSSFYD